MKLNSKVTGGLAWAGLVLVLAVPSAEMLTKPAESSALPEAAGDAMTTASIATQPATQAVSPVEPMVRPVVPATRKVAVAAVADPVEQMLASGKPLPSYISDAPDAAPQGPVATPRLVVPAGTAEVKPDGTFADGFDAEVAAVAPPKPYPASMRPAPTATAALPGADAAPLIIDEDALTRRQAAIRPVEPFVPVEAEQIVTGDELEAWDSGSLADYLERKDLLSDAEPERRGRNFDEDGFFLSDGPNRSRARRVDDDVDFFLF